MVKLIADTKVRAWYWGAGALLVLLSLALWGPGVSGAAPARPGGPPARAILAAAALNATQDFQDVPSSSPFFTYLHNLVLANVVAGYNCGGVGEPCVTPDNLPYYRPAAAVTRLQMTKFIDQGRRNIADAVGHSLYISTTAGIAVDAETRSGGEAVYAECLQSGNNCYALEGYAPTGDYAGYMYGGKGVYAESDDAAQAAVDAHAYGANAYGMHAESAAGRGAYAKSDLTTNYSMYVDSQGGPSQATAALNVVGTIRGEGNLVIAGSKAGYVVDIMQNVDRGSLEAGDVVVIAGAAAPVLGQIPVVTVKKASSGNDTAVVGIVDQMWYAPDAATKAAYEAQEAAINAATAARAGAQKAAEDGGAKPDLAALPMPDRTITDEQGTLHALPDATSAAPQGYVSVVTLGAYKAVKVDAAFGAIHAGDLLTTSAHAGYAQKVSDKAAAMGAVIGKALADLPAGAGTIPVMVSLK